MSGASSTSQLIRPDLAAPSDNESLSLFKHDSGFFGLGFAGLEEDLAACETCAESEAVGMIAPALAENSFTDANLLYDGDDLNPSSTQWLIRDAHIEHPYQRRWAPASLRLSSGSVHACFLCIPKTHVATPGLLAAGPAGYAYVAVSARTSE